MPFFKAVACLSLTILCGLQAAHSSEVCGRSAPPMDSALNMVHGAVVFIYPRSMEPGFSGCQKMWGPTGETWVTLKFEQGALVLAEIFEHGRPHAALSCSYRGGKLITDLEDCPAYEDAAAGMKTMPLEAERRIIPPVAKERDPRK